MDGVSLLHGAARPRSLPGVALTPSRMGEASVVALCALVIGSVPLFPIMIIWRLWRALKSDPHSQGQRRAWTIFGTILAVYLGLMFIPVRKRPRLMQASFWRCWLEYFSVQIAYRGGEPLPPQQYLYCLVPHGLYPFSGAIAGLSKMVDVFPRMRIGVAEVGFWIPLIRQLMGWIGCISVDKSSAASALRDGDSVAFFPGGIAEMVMTDSERERLVLLGRKGIMKLALEHGVPIVPVYVFGQSTLWSHLNLPEWVHRLSRFLRLSIIFPYGRFGFLIPRKLRLLYAIGAPIPCPRVDGTPSEEQIGAAHSSVVAAVKELYDAYKGYYGWQDRPLSIE